MRCIAAVWTYRHLIAHKSWADFRAESQRTFLGIAWWLLDPVINVIIYYLCFGVFMNRAGGDYIPYLTTGIIAWMWFFSALTTGASAIWNNAQVIRQVALPKIIFPVAQIAVCTYRFLFSLIVLFSILFLWGYRPDAYWLLLPLLMAVELLFIAGLTFVFAAFVPFVPDLANFIQYAFRLIFFLSCVMYKLESLSPNAQAWLRYNPIVYLLDAYRDVLMYHTLPNFAAIAAISLFGLAGAAAGMLLIDRLGPIYAKRIVR
ncbi:MAG: ABC transporter permease [Candidatus Hydrogenedentes bacterium]|nr:ABC transporter permease [Candidatus Hydrogenedentota bacterium]